MTDARTEAGRQDHLDDGLRQLRAAILTDDRAAAMVHLDDGTTAAVVALTADARELLALWWRDSHAVQLARRAATCTCEACRVRAALNAPPPASVLRRVADNLDRAVADARSVLARMDEEGATRDLGRP